MPKSAVRACRRGRRPLRVAAVSLVRSTASGACAASGTRVRSWRCGPPVPRRPGACAGALSLFTRSNERRFCRAGNIRAAASGSGSDWDHAATACPDRRRAGTPAAQHGAPPSGTPSGCGITQYAGRFSLTLPRPYVTQTAEARKAHDGAAAVQFVHGRGVDGGCAPARTQEADVVDAGGKLRHEIRDLNAALAPFGKLARLRGG